MKSSEIVWKNKINLKIMKVCDLCMLYYPHGGGIKTYIDNKRLVYKKKGVEHILIAPNDSNPRKLEKLREGTTVIYYVPCFKLKIFGTSYSIFRGFKEVREILKSEKPDVIEISDKITTLLFKEKIKKIHREISTKIFGFSHERSDNFAKTVTGSKIIGFLLSEIFNRRFIGAIDEVITNSHFTGEEVLRYLSAEKVNVVTLGIDIDNFKKSDYYDINLRNELTGNEKKKILVHVGRLDMEKKIDLLIEITKELNPNGYKVIIIGGGAMENELKKVPAVKAMGHVSQIDVRRYLAVSDIGILVNDIEPYGLVGLEMMAMGLPILGPNKGGLTTFLRKNFAFLCDHNKNSYLNSLDVWENLSGEEKKAMSDNALKIVQGYTLDNMVEQLFKVYEKNIT